MVSCTGSKTKDAVAGSLHQGGFEQAMERADSLYNHMQFRDAYNL